MDVANGEIDVFLIGSAFSGLWNLLMLLFIIS